MTPLRQALGKWWRCRRCCRLHLRCGGDRYCVTAPTSNCLRVAVQHGMRVRYSLTTNEGLAGLVALVERDMARWSLAGIDSAHLHIEPAARAAMAGTAPARAPGVSGPVQVPAAPAENEPQPSCLQRACHAARRLLSRASVP